MWNETEEDSHVEEDYSPVEEDSPLGEDESYNEETSFDEDDSSIESNPFEFKSCSEVISKSGESSEPLFLAECEIDRTSFRGPWTNWIRWKKSAKPIASTKRRGKSNLAIITDDLFIKSCSLIGFLIYYSRVLEFRSESVTLCARVLAYNFAIEDVERAWPLVPDHLRLRIAFWSFPDNREDLLSSYLANGSIHEYERATHYFSVENVDNPVQVGNKMLAFIDDLHRLSA